MKHPPLVRKSLDLSGGLSERPAVTRWVTPVLRESERGDKHFGMFAKGSVLFEMGDHVAYHLGAGAGTPSRRIGCIVGLKHDPKSGMVVLIQPFTTTKGTITSIDEAREERVSPGTKTH